MPLRTPSHRTSSNRFSLFALCLMHLALCGALAADAPVAGPAVPDAGDAAGPKPARRVHPMAALMNNPDAWTEPEFGIALVNEGGAVDEAWLEAFTPGLARYCQLRFDVVPLEAADDASIGALLARAKAAAGEKDKAWIVFSDDVAEPIVTAPGSGWAILSPAWVRADAGADKDKTAERMGKQLYRALGLAFGAGYRLEPQAVLRDAPTPQSLDEALSKNFHPQNLSIVQAVAARMGIQTRRLKPRAELERLGLLPPRKNPLQKEPAP